MQSFAQKVLSDLCNSRYLKVSYYSKVVFKPNLKLIYQSLKAKVITSTVLPNYESRGTKPSS